MTTHTTILDTIRDCESGAFFSPTSVGVVGVWQHVFPSVSDTCTIVHGFQSWI